jgi:hypothetical protein
MEKIQQWRRLDRSLVDRDIVDEVRAALVREKEAGHELKVCIGTDSQVKGAETEFATVIVRANHRFVVRRTDIRPFRRTGYIF